MSRLPTTTRLVGNRDPLEPMQSSSPTDITARNSTDSPLFRLPAELRNMIWQYAYGNLTVHVRSHGKRIRYYICLEDHSTRDLYQMSQEGPSPNNALNWNNLILEQHVGLLCCIFEPLLQSILTFPIVSKQFWNEVLGAFLATSTIDFKSATTFSNFVLSGHAIIPRIRHLSFEMAPSQVPHSNYTGDLCEELWSKALSCRAIGQFKDLQGVHMRSHLLLSQRIARPFQQTQLDANKTFVVFLINPYQYTRLAWNTTVVELKQAAEKFRMKLLEHRPRRVSSREKAEWNYLEWEE